MEEVSCVVGQSKAISQDELLIALVAIVAVQGMTLHKARMLSAIASHSLRRDFICDVTQMAILGSIRSDPDNTSAHSAYKITLCRLFVIRSDSFSTDWYKAIVRPFLTNSNRQHHCTHLNATDACCRQKHLQLHADRACLADRGVGDEGERVCACRAGMP